MRELERDLPSPTSASPALALSTLAIVGRGRVGNALSAAFRRAGVTVVGPLGRDDVIPPADAVLLCVPDAALPAAARAVDPGPFVGHCSGALTRKVYFQQAAEFHEIVFELRYEKCYWRNTSHATK